MKRSLLKPSRTTTLFACGLGVAICGAIALTISPSAATARETVATPDAASADEEAYIRVPESIATTEEEMKPYSQPLRDSPLSLDMVPIPGGTFTLGSSDEERKRFEEEFDLDPIVGESPQLEVKIEPFWMAKYETTWDLYDTYRTNLDIQRRGLTGRAPDDVDKLADAVTRPTAAYTDMTFDMGHDGYPAICMTQLAAKSFCEWLTAKTGQYYRLPSEAEWEYACRAGTTTAFSWGDSIEEMDEYAWFTDNVNPEGLSPEEEAAFRFDQYQKIGLKKPNPWGLYDMHGNVSEWCLDGYREDAYEIFASMPEGEMKVIKPFAIYPRTVRGGSWYDYPEMLRSAARTPSDPTWKIQDPQLPQSMWYHTDAKFVGFRVIRPLNPPSEDEIKKYTLYPDVPPELVK